MPRIVLSVLNFPRCVRDHPVVFGLSAALIVVVTVTLLTHLYAPSPEEMRRASIAKAVNFCADNADQGEQLVMFYCVGDTFLKAKSVFFEKHPHLVHRGEQSLRNPRVWSASHPDALLAGYAVIVGKRRCE